MWTICHRANEEYWRDLSYLDLERGQVNKPALHNSRFQGMPPLYLGFLVFKWQNVQPTATLQVRGSRLHIKV